jgi:ABC-type amino acid transport system permease subunit
MPGTYKIGLPISVDLPTASSTAFSPGMVLKKVFSEEFLASLTSYNMIIITVNVKANIADFSSLKKLRESGRDDSAKVSSKIPTIPPAYT